MDGRSKSISMRIAKWLNDEDVAITRVILWRTHSDCRGHLAGDLGLITTLALLIFNKAVIGKTL